MIALKAFDWINKFFNNEKWFAAIFIIILLVDVSLKFDIETLPYRVFSKSIGTILLLSYLYVKSVNIKSKKPLIMALALILFLIGDIIFIRRFQMTFFSAAIVCMLLAKACFIYCFLHQNDFKVSRLVPFFLFCFVYLSAILYSIFEQLTSYYFIQVLTYFFVALMTALFAFLRKEAVNKLSYRLVLIGVLISFISDGVTALNMFSETIHYTVYSSTLITVAYGVSQYLIVSGLLKDEQELVG